MITRVFVDTPRSAAENMALDEQLFQEAETEQFSGITVRFYSWTKPAISFGYRQTLERVDQNKARTLAVELVRRVTGGGMVFHQPNELTYCLVAENTLFPASILQSCNLISRKLIDGLQTLGVSAVLAGRSGTDRCAEELCFSRPTKYEVLVDGRKLIGSAQKRGRRSFMQHGSLALEPLLPVFAELIDIAPVHTQQISLAEILGRRLHYAIVARAMEKQFR